MQAIAAAHHKAVGASRGPAAIQQAVPQWALAFSAAPAADAKKAGASVATAACHLTADEDERLRAACKAKNLDRGEAVRRAVGAVHLR
jgi:hypothetical protein